MTQGILELWMAHCVRHAVSFKDCNRGASVLMERDEDGSLSNEAFYLANGFKGLVDALENERINPATAAHQTIDWNSKRF